MKRPYLIRFLAISCLFLGLSIAGSAQQSAATDLFYVQMPGLSTDNYDDLVHALKEHPQFELKSACIPAHVIEVRMKSVPAGGKEEAFVQFSQAIASAGLSNNQLLTEYSPAAFMERCRSARLGQ